MNLFDKNIILFLNGFVHRWPHVDVVILEFQHNHFLKGAFFIALLWYFWFESRDQHIKDERRAKLFGTLCAVACGIFIARLLANLLPFRPRPLANPELHLRLPGFRTSDIVDWSAFPSDHAVVWFALAAGIYTVHRRWGIAALLYAAFLSIDRIYVCYHHPTDVIAGALIGAGIVMLFCSQPLRSILYAPIARYELQHAGLFYSVGFLVTYELANLFNEARGLALLAWQAMLVFHRMYFD